MSTNTIRAAVAGLVGMAALVAFPSGAGAAAETQMSTEVPTAVDDDFDGVSTLTIPSGRPPVLDVNAVGVTAFTPIGSGDRQLRLIGPNSVQSLLIGPFCNTFSAQNVSFDDQATGGGFGCAGLAGSSFSPKTPLSPLSDPVEGKWTMNFVDPGNQLQAGPGQLSSWGLRVTYAPLTLTASAVKQKPGPNGELALTATCNGDCSVFASGDAAGEVKLNRNIAGQVVATLSQQGLSQFKAGKKDSASITLAASNDLNEAIVQQVTVPLEQPATAAKKCAKRKGSKGKAGKSGAKKNKKCRKGGKKKKKK